MVPSALRAAMLMFLRCQLDLLLGDVLWKLYDMSFHVIGQVGVD